jgi:amino acid transporter
MLTTPRVSNVSLTLSRSRLGVPAVVFFVISAAAPLTVIAGGITTAYAVTGVTAIPIAFLAVAAMLGLFSVGYVAMARHITNAGAFYTYVTHGLGRPAGVATSLIAVGAYNLLQVALYGGLGVAAGGLFGTGLPWWFWALAAWVLVALLGVLRVDLNGRVLAVLLTAEIAVVLVYDAAALAHPAGGGGLSLGTLSPAGLLQPGIGAALVIAITGFFGFEAATVFSEETRNPSRTVPLATYIAVALTGALYAVSAWAMAVATGPDRVVAVTQRDGTETIFGLADAHLGGTIVHIGRILFVTSLFAALLSFHNAVARYLFALGREHVLPAALGRTARRTGAPKVASAVQSAIALTVVIGYAAAGLDPLIELFFWLGVTGGFGALVLIGITSFAVVGFFARRRALRENAWRRLIAPGLAAVLLTVVIALAVKNFATLLGVPATDPLRWLLPGGYVVLAGIGWAWALMLRSRRPETYRTIGLGANASTGRNTPVEAIV